MTCRACGRSFPQRARLVTAEGNPVTTSSVPCVLTHSSTRSCWPRPQAQRAHLVTAELNPVLYAWGQWYAQNQASPPPMASPPPEAYNNICKVRGGGGVHVRREETWAAGGAGGGSPRPGRCPGIPASQGKYGMCYMATYGLFEGTAAIPARCIPIVMLGCK